MGRERERDGRRRRRSATCWRRGDGDIITAEVVASVLASLLAPLSRLARNENDNFATLEFQTSAGADRRRQACWRGAFERSRLGGEREKGERKGFRRAGRTSGEGEEAFGQRGSVSLWQRRQPTL